MEQTTLSEEPKMEDTIRETLNSINERNAEDSEEITEVKEEKPRDEKVRIATNEVTETTDEVKPARKAPNSWKPEAQAKYATLDPLLQDEVDRREGDFHKGLSSYQQKAAMADEYEKAMSPYLPTIQKLNVKPAQAVAHLMNLDHRLRYGGAQEKQAVLSAIANDFGIDIGQAAQAPRADPIIQQLQQQVNQLSSSLQQQYEERSAAQEREMINQIEDFRKLPESKHFDTVCEDMTALLQSRQAANLKEAYEKAIWANPISRQALLEEHQVNLKAEAKKKTEDAKRANSLNVVAKGSASSASAVGTMDDTIRENAKRLGMIN